MNLTKIYNLKKTRNFLVSSNCLRYNYSPNKLAELSAIPPSTLRATLANRVDNPSATNIFKICKTLKISIKDFFDSDLFKDIDNY